jgi:predicted nucleotidyltransferase
MVKITPKLNVSLEEIEAFCKRWKVKEFALFGSALRKDFRPDRDVDVMVTFEEGARRGLFVLADMQLELEELLGRSVDLLTRSGVEASRNPFRRKSILESTRVIYTA